MVETAIPNNEYINQRFPSEYMEEDNHLSPEKNLLQPPPSHSPISGASNEHDDVPLEEDDDEIEYHDEEATNYEDAPVTSHYTITSETEDNHEDTYAPSSEEYEAGEIDDLSRTPTMGPDNAMTFQQIRDELEHKDVSGSLQPQSLLAAKIGGIRVMPEAPADVDEGEHQAPPNCAPVAENGASNGLQNSPSTPVNQSQAGDKNFNSVTMRGQKPPSSEAPFLGNTKTRLTYVIGDCLMNNLIVYPDKAHVYRRETPRFNANEVTEVLFTEVSPAIDKNSVRVELRGRATILDVTLHERVLDESEDTLLQTCNQMHDEIRHCRKDIEVILSRISRAEKQRAVLDTYAEKMTGLGKSEDAFCNGLDEDHSLCDGKATSGRSGKGKAPKTLAPNSQQALMQLSAMALQGDKDSSMNPYDPRMMDTLSRFLTTYEEKANMVDTMILDGEEEIERLKARIEYLEKHMQEMELKHDDSVARELSVMVEPRESGTVEMIISYVVGRCTWKPAYDIRMFNSDGSMKIIYYGMVQQATGENWTQIPKMTLSTAQPGLGGTVPQLGLQTVHYRQNFQPSSTTISIQHSSRAKKFAATPIRRSHRSQSHSINELDLVDSPRGHELVTPGGTLHRTLSTAMETTGPRPGLKMGPQSRRNLGTSLLLNACPPSAGPCGIPDFLLNGASKTDSSGNKDGSLPSVQFDVPRPLAMIKCDHTPHRATVGLIDLQPQYDYVSVPKRSPYAFLKATAVNQSNFYLLPGQTNIYSDNSFIGKVDMKAVAPGEQFNCQLGAEHGIKLSYRPMFKYKEGNSSGSKCLMTFKQMIEVKNTFDRQIKLTIIDQVPVSGEEKIKVSLIEPVIKHPERYDKSKAIRMNKNNNVEWDLDLQPNEVRELTLKFSVEHPANEELDVTVAEPITT